MAEGESDAGGEVHFGLYHERFQRALRQTLRGVEGPRKGSATWLGQDRFRIEGEFTLLELTCIYVAARDCYPAGTIEGRRVRGAMPPWW